jgi:uncharacterized protein (DUF302 family)
MLASEYTVKETIDRLVISLQLRGMTIYARIDRQIESKWHGFESRLLEYILIDDPRLSGPMIERYPTLALCFPVRMMAWEDDGCWVAYKDPRISMRDHLPGDEDFYWPDLRPVIIGALSE